VNGFDVSVYAIRRRPGRRRPFEVRWRAAGRSRSKSFITRRLADSYRAELVRAARTGLDFDPLTGEPTAWNLPELATVTWYQQATAYAVMKWPSLAAHSRASLADTLATVTPALIRKDARNRPDPRELRTALYQHAFNPARPAGPGSAEAQILNWAQQASLPIGHLSEPAVLRAALEALTVRLDRSRAAANEARRSYRQAIETDHPEYAPKAMVNLAVLEGKLGNPEEAQRRYRQAIETRHSEQSPKAVFGLGLLAMETGNRSSARRHFQQTIETGHPDYGPSAMASLGALAEEQGESWAGPPLVPAGNRDGPSRTCAQGHAQPRRAGSGNR
jgi:hypothetical protein